THGWRMRSRWLTRGRERPDGGDQWFRKTLNLPHERGRSCSGFRMEPTRSGDQSRHPVLPGQEAGRLDCGERSKSDRLRPGAKLPVATRTVERRPGGSARMEGRRAEAFE